MEVIATDFEGLKILRPKVHGDPRGYFVETYNQRELEKHGIKLNFVQDNQSRSARGTFRGLHFQKEPMAQSKLLRAVEGEILDVVVDLRKDQSTYLKTFSTRLSAENFQQLLVPKGFAHGFLVLSETAVVSYKCDQFYSPENEFGISHLDPVVKIDWPMDPSTFLLSERDNKWPQWQTP